MAAAAPGVLPALLAPVALGPLRLPSRVVSTSHQTGLVEGHVPTEDLVAYHAARARGGVGAIFLEATAVHPTGLLTAHTIGGWLAEVVPAFRRLADAVHHGGAGLLVQLFHGGREQIDSAPRAPAVAPSAVPSPRFKSEPRALTGREIRDLLEGYALAARRAREGGLDGVEVSKRHDRVHRLQPGLHQYQRALYLARLGPPRRAPAAPRGARRAGRAARPAPRLLGADGAPAARRHPRAGPGPVPEDGLWTALEGRPGCVRAGDVLGPRSAEEAVLEGTRCVEAVVAAPEGR